MKKMKIHLNFNFKESAGKKLSVSFFIDSKNKYLLYLLGAQIANYEASVEEEKNYYFLHVQLLFFLNTTFLKLSVSKLRIKIFLLRSFPIFNIFFNISFA